MTTPLCSAGSLAADEAVIGSAPDAVAWVCLEQNGPWGAKAWTDSHLDAELGARIEALAAEHRVRPSLIRRPGRHADDARTGSRRVLVAHTSPGRTWLLDGEISDPAELLALDWAAAARGDADAVLASVRALRRTDENVLLVCTNGTRDQCCALSGRPVATSAARVLPGRVWEVTHTSGHRFAATTVLLPAGVLHGRVMYAAPLLLAADEGELVLTGYRGRSTWSAGAQVAEEHVRSTYGILGLDDLEVSPEIDAWRVRHRDGRSWWVAVTAAESGERAESCGKELKPITRYRARIVR